MRDTATSLALIETAIEGLGQAARQLTPDEAHGDSPLQEVFSQIQPCSGTAHGYPDTFHKPGPIATVVGLCIQGALGLLTTAQDLLNSSAATPSYPDRARNGPGCAAGTELLHGMASHTAQLVQDPIPVMPPLENIRDQARARYFGHWSAIQNDQITASEFIAYLRPLADLDGVSVVHQDYDTPGDDLRDALDSNTWDMSPFGYASATKPSSETTMAFALNEEGQVWIRNDLDEP